MREIANLAVVGMMIGATYGMIGFSLTLMFRSTGVLSFAHAGFALVAAYIYSALSCRGAQCSGEPVSPFLAATVAIAVVTVLALLVERFVIRHLDHAGATTRLVATAGVLALCAGLTLQLFGSTPKSVPSTQMVAQGGFNILDVIVQSQRAVLFGVSLTLVAILSLFLRRTWLGLAIRASSERPDVAQMLGARPPAIGRFNWGVAGLLSGLAGVLVAPLTVITVGTFPLLVTRALGASLIGGLASLPLTFAGGLALGIIESLVPHFWLTPGGPDVVIAVVVTVLLARNRRRIGEWRTDRTAPPQAVAVPGAFARSLAWLVLALREIPVPLYGAALFAGFALSARDTYWSSVGLNVVFYALVALSFYLSTGLGGQPSLMQSSFVGIGAFSFTTTLHRGASVPLAFAVALAATLLAGLLSGAVALRYRGVAFAVLSINLAAAVSGYLLVRPELHGAVEDAMVLGVNLSDSRNAFRLMAVFALVAFLCVRNVRRSSWGSALSAARQGPVLLAHCGINPVRHEVAAFGLSAMVAGLAGCGFALAASRFGPIQFLPLISITLLLVAVVGGTRSLWGPVIAGLIFGWGPQLAGSHFAEGAFLQLASAALALLIVVRLPDGLASLPGWAEKVVRAAPIGDIGFRAARGVVLSRPAAAPRLTGDT